MSRYWEDAVYEQPSEEKIRKNAADTVQKEKKKGKNLSPVIIAGRVIAKEWWAGHGAKTWSAMRIMRAGLTGEKDMLEPAR